MPGNIDPKYEQYSVFFSNQGEVLYSVWGINNEALSYLNKNTRTYRASISFSLDLFYLAVANWYNATVKLTLLVILFPRLILCPSQVIYLSKFLSSIANDYITVFYGNNALSPIPTLLVSALSNVVAL